MGSATLKKLVSVQNTRLAEIKLMYSRMKERPRDTLNISIVKSRIGDVREIWVEARKTHSEITAREEAETDKDTLDYFLTVAADIEKGSSSLVDGFNANSSESRPAKLPKLDLPTFSGRYEDWESFCDLFTSLVHNAPRVDDSTKLHYLKSCLTGPAADLAKDVSTTSANYASTWKALKARFYNPRLTVYNHTNALFNMPHLKKESAIEMRTFADEAQRIVRALTNLKMPTEHWDIWFVQILSSRLDTESRKLWESELSAKDRAPHTNTALDEDINPLSRFPTFTELSGFLEKRAYALSMISYGSDNKADKKTYTASKSFPGSRRVFHANSRQPYKNDSPKCPLCTGFHFLSRCPDFLAKTPYARRSDVRHLRLCYNCLGRHKFRECTSKNRCNSCREKHHSLIHMNARAPPASQTTSHGPEPSTADGKGKQEAGINVHAANISLPEHPVILATAQVNIIGPHGAHTRVRALLDQGSEGSFVTEAVVQLLGLPRQRVDVPLSVVGGNITERARARTNFTLRSINDSNFEINVEALVLPRLTSQLPARKLIELDISEFAELILADPHFHIPDSVDIILGADIYSRLLRPGLRRFASSELMAQDTELGWILSGSLQAFPVRRAEQGTENALRTMHGAPRDDLYEKLERFWLLEELPQTIPCLSPEEELCEKQFSDTHTRSADGRYIVHLPRKGNPPEVGAETRRMALGSLSYVHRRFARDPALALAYRTFMEEYEQQGHMSRIANAERNDCNAWYLPHHAVVNPSKIRVVFDASRQTRDHHCLNDFLMTDPPLQRDLALILLNWRRYKFVFTADIVKMFRQIRIHPDDRELQRIVWAPTAQEQPMNFYLNTVTYGTACAPYLAIRTLSQLAQDERSRFPLGARCLESDTYVDDTFAGADELPLAIRKRTELINILKSAGIELNKWAANHPALLPSHAKQNKAPPTKPIDTGNSIKTLGVHWIQSDDKFCFSTQNLYNRAESLTKRSILSGIARPFDPLGWISPITIQAKALMQDLWINKCDWDAPLPSDIHVRWLEYCDSLGALPTLSIKRWLGTSENQYCEIHGFSDASSRAYAAAVYLRTRDSDEIFRINLIAAKTKVAPVKTVSIPNLELCGAALLVKLVSHLKTLEFIKELPIYLWTDSEIVLKWLSKHPCFWKTFVANRVSQIQTQLPNAIWSHVYTKENPADIATRGASPVDLRDSSLWWHGPDWLSRTADQWPSQNTPAKILHSQVHIIEPDILMRFSSLSKLIRVVAYCMRPLTKLRRRLKGLDLLPDSLTSSELTTARTKIIHIAQLNAFSAEISLLRAGKRVTKGSSLSKLNPILDENDGILRVGGRLAHSNLSYARKDPPILPRHSSLSKLFIRHVHHLTLHGGPTLTLNVLRQYIWVLGSKQVVKSIIHKCIKCQRVKPRLAHQLMGNLPVSRVTPSRPFTTSGVDYAGPFQIRTAKGRGNRTYKGYIALFVCFSTRAIHLELVSDLTTAAFISAYRRFISRRGACRYLYSDNATTFRGADSELRMMFQAASKFYQHAASILANDGTTWTFIPPATPHYGGWWEAGVKSTKHHLKRALGEHTFTFEEFTTVLAEIEACLNSRPLCPISSNIEDLDALTPAHFLIGETSGFIPDAEPLAVPENRLSRFQLMQRLRIQFWKRWADEYLQHLQERAKWRDPTENFAIGQLVALRDDRYPSARWPLGRVLEVHPGADGRVRVVTVKTASNTFRRHIARLSPLFLDSEINKAT